jgi:hypothetical protein
VADISGRRVGNVEDNPGRHDAMNDGLQPADKNRLSFTGFPVDESKGPTVFPLVGAEATDRWVTISLMALPGEAKLPRTYRNLDNKADVQDPEDYLNRVSRPSSEAVADFTNPTSTQSKEFLLPEVSPEIRSRSTRRRQYHRFGARIRARTGHEVGWNGVTGLS